MYMFYTTASNALFRTQHITLHPHDPRSVRVTYQRALSVTTITQAESSVHHIHVSLDRKSPVSLVSNLVELSQNSALST
jgi:hypothetical protein